MTRQGTKDSHSPLGTETVLDGTAVVATCHFTFVQPTEHKRVNPSVNYTLWEISMSM